MSRRAPTPPMVLRGRAADACIRRFEGRPMKWGRIDCVQLAAHNLRQLGIATPQLKGLVYRSELGALKELKALGFANLRAAVDATPGLFPIPPAAATAADLLAMKTDSRLWDVALAVHVGKGKSLGLHTDGHARVITHDLGLAVAAWRCNPCRR